MGTTAVNGDDKVNAGLCLALSNQLGDFIAEAVSSEGLMPFFCMGLRFGSRLLYVEAVAATWSMPSFFS